MNRNSDMKDTLLQHQNAIIEMLWQKVDTHYRYFNDIGGLAVGDGSNNNSGLIVRYLKNLNKTEKNPLQFISVKHDQIDLVLRRFMLEAALFRITIDFDIDELTDLSTELALEVIDAIEECFEKSFKYRPNTHLFLCIKNEKDHIHIWVDKGESLVFDEKIILVV